MDTSVVLKFARITLEKARDKRPTGGMKTTVEGYEVRASYTDIIEELEKLEKLALRDRLRTVRPCKTCKRYNSAPNHKFGVCWGRIELGMRRKEVDFCSGWKGREKA